MKFIRITILSFIILFGTLINNTSAQIPVKIGDIDSPNEPSVIINRKNTNEVLCGANLNNLYLSHDAGNTWNRKVMTSSFGVWGDPVVISDTAGRYYYFHLSNPPSGNWIDRIVCQVSDDYGSSWSNGSFTGLNKKKAQDKHWAVYDEKRGKIYLSWTQFDKYNSKSTSDKSSILYSESDDNALTWSKPIQLNYFLGDCIDSSMTTEGAVPTYSNDGEVYVAWAGPMGIRINKKDDEGWLSLPILVDSNKAGWTYKIPGVSRCNGLPITQCDRSGGIYEGRVYVNWSSQQNGLDNTDVFLKYSDDKGLNWSATKNIGKNKAKNHQFLTWMTIDQTTGILYFVYYDRSRFDDNKTDVILATSYDGGEHYKYQRIKQDAFVPTSKKFFGDYNNIDAYNGEIQLVWTRMDAENTSVWTIRLDERKRKIKKMRAKMTQQK